MDVERTLRELETKWRKVAAQPSEPKDCGCDYDADDELRRCADELKAVREALREPGSVSVEQIKKVLYKAADDRLIRAELADDDSPYLACEYEAVAKRIAALSSKQEPPAPAALSPKVLDRILKDIKMDEIKRPLPHKVEHDIPRRCRLDLATPVEQAIRDARQRVEAMPADVRLTDATVLLGQALERVADYLENVTAPPVEGKQEPGAEAAPPMPNIKRWFCEKCGQEHSIAMPVEGGIFLTATEAKRVFSAEESARGSSSTFTVPPLEVVQRGDSIEPRAAAGESTELRAALLLCVESFEIQGMKDSTAYQIAKKALAASQERSATEEK
jgi:hypothetical protein